MKYAGCVVVQHAPDHGQPVEAQRQVEVRLRVRDLTAERQLAALVVHDH